LRFVNETRDVEWVQTVATVNNPQTAEYTRITEYKHLTGQTHARTNLTYAYPTDVGDPYYPIPRSENHAPYKRYRVAAEQLLDVWFVGPLDVYQVSEHGSGCRSGTCDVRAYQRDPRPDRLFACRRMILPGKCRSPAGACCWWSEPGPA
jgi:hypothetical protein